MYKKYAFYFVLNHKLSNDGNIFLYVGFNINFIQHGFVWNFI